MGSLLVSSSLLASGADTAVSELSDGGTLFSALSHPERSKTNANKSINTFFNIAFTFRYFSLLSSSAQ